jgi:hypothetical protein
MDDTDARNDSNNRSNCHEGSIRVDDHDEWRDYTPPEDTRAASAIRQSVKADSMLAAHEYHDELSLQTLQCSILSRPARRPASNGQQHGWPSLRAGAGAIPHHVSGMRQYFHS